MTICRYYSFFLALVSNENSFLIHWMFYDVTSKICKENKGYMAGKKNKQMKTG